MRRAVLLLLALAACAAPAPETGFRDRAIPVASTLRGGEGDLAGDWLVSAAFPGGPVAPGGEVAFAPGEWRLGGERVPVATSGPGRTRAADGREYWLLWADEGFRTAVIGTPSGAFGWIMHRPGQAAPDREAAAHEILDFNGYDLSRLRG